MEIQLQQLFVYGSLRSGFKHPAYEYISRYFNLVGKAKVKGKMYDMGNFPAAIACTDPAYIAGELYVLKDSRQFSWAFEQLDDYEGVHGEENEPPMYVRAISDVYMYNETISTAWIYWYNGNISNKPFIASGDILEYIKQKSKF